MHIAKQKSNVIKKDQLFLEHKNKGWGGEFQSKYDFCFTQHVTAHQQH